MKKGHYYEEKTAELVQKFNPNAQVLQGIRITGKLSKQKREVDVQLVDPGKYDQIIFECKDHKAKVGIELVEALVTKLKDLGAENGAVVSNSGFTKGAYKIAEAHGVDLLTIVDTEDSKIRTQIFAPNIIEDTYVERGGLHLNGLQGMFRLEPNVHATLIKTADGNITWADLLAKHWDEVEMKAHPGVGEHRITLDNATIIDLDGREVKVSRLEIVYLVKKRFYLRNVRLIDTQGIYNVSKQTYRTNSITTEKIRVKDFSDPRLWTLLSEEEAGKMRVPFRLMCVTPMEQNGRKVETKNTM